MNQFLSFFNKFWSRRPKTVCAFEAQMPSKQPENAGDEHKNVKIECNSDEPSRIEGVPAAEIMAWQQELINQITGFLGFSKNVTEKYFLPVVRNYVEYVHLLPASEAHHHNGVGGLVIHGLETCLFAVKLAENSLPYTGSEPSLKKKYEIKWRLAVAIAALIHDVAKVATDLTVTNEEGLDWLPFSGSLSDWLAEKHVSHYYITYRQNRGKKHEDYAITIARTLIPQETMSFLESGNAAGIIYKLFAALNVTNSEADASLYDIRDLVIKADSLSVEKDLSETDKTDSISNGLPLDGYFLCVVRNLLQENCWSINFFDSALFYSSVSYLGAKCIYINWSHGVFDSFYEMIEKMPEIHGVPKNIKKLASYLFERGFCAGSELHFRIMLKPGFTQSDIDVLSSRLKENFALPVNERSAVKEILKELELKYLEVLPFSRADLVFGAVLPPPEKLFFVEESEVVCEQDKSFATPVHDEVFSHGQDLRFGNKKTEMQEKLPEQKKMSADDITLSLFEDLQEDETKPESVEVSATVSGQKNEPETEEKPEKKSEESAPKIIYMDADKKLGTAGLHRTRIKHIETDIDILSGKKKPPKHFVPNRQEYMQTFYASQELPESRNDNTANIINNSLNNLKKNDITSALFAEVIGGKKTLSPKVFVQQSDKYGIRVPALEYIRSLRADLTPDNTAEVLVNHGITIKDKMGNFLSRIGSEEGLLLSSELCNALIMLDVNVCDDKTAEVTEALDTSPAEESPAENDAEPASPAETDEDEIREEEDLPVPEDLSSAMERIHKMLISQLLKKYRNPDYESLFLTKENEVTRVAEGQYMCDVPASDLCERINNQLSAWNYEIDSLTLNRFLAGHSASMTRQFLAVTNVQEDVHD